MVAPGSPRLPPLSTPAHSAAIGEGPHITLQTPEVGAPAPVTTRGEGVGWHGPIGRRLASGAFERRERGEAVGHVDVLGHQVDA